MAKRQRRRIPKHLLLLKPSKAKASKRKPKPAAKPAKSQRHAEAGHANKGNTYNDVAQGRENVTVHVPTAQATLTDINTRVASVSAESDDILPSARKRLNTPGWNGGDYKPHSTEAADVFAAAFNVGDEEFITGLDDQVGPTASDLTKIEYETAKLP